METVPSELVNVPNINFLCHKNEKLFQKPLIKKFNEIFGKLSSTIAQKSTSNTILVVLRDKFICKELERTDVFF